MERWRAIFGIILLLSLVTLAAVIAIGHIEEKTSYGLQQVLGILAVLSGAFANWAFGSKNDDKPKGD